MRRRILWVTMTSVLLAMAVLGLPLAFAVSHIVGADERRELERLALRAAVAVTPTYHSGDPLELPAVEDGVVLAVYDGNGRRIVGSGPAALEPGARLAMSGSIAEADVHEQIVEAVPVTRGERVIAIVRAASPESSVVARTIRWDLALLAGCTLAAGCAAALAGWQSRRLARPLEELARAAGELGAGDFSVRTMPTGVAEIDGAGTSLNRTAERLASMIEHERNFSTYASHQLRTPLTQLQLELETGLDQGGDRLRDAASAAMVSADQLSQTIDDVLTSARSGTSLPGFEIEEMLEELRDRWVGILGAADRPLRLVVEDPPRVAASVPAVRQILQVLLENAVRHGRGAVTLRARESHGAVAIDVVDQGSAPPLTIAEPGRLGLSLARSLATAQRGRLLVDQLGPGTRFTLLLPAASDPEPPDRRL